jgi:DNA-binding GntR family transcriptional regulator
MKDLVPISRAKSLKEQAYEILKGMIVTGRLEQDKLHNEKRLAEALGVSRTPVREALLELSREGMIVFFPGRGFEVRKFTLQEIQEVFEVRRIIEGHVIQTISERLTEADVQQIDRLIAKLGRLAGKNDRAAFIETDKEFHQFLASRMGNRQIQTILMGLRDQIHLMGIQALEYYDRMQQVIQEHRRIYSALRDKDGERARDEMLLHLRNTESILTSNHVETLEGEEARQR